MTTNLAKIPGYSRNIVLVGWPKDEVPDLAPHHVRLIKGDARTILQAEEELRQADFVAFFPSPSLFSLPPSKAGVETDYELTVSSSAPRPRSWRFDDARNSSNPDHSLIGHLSGILLGLFQDEPLDDNRSGRTGILFMPDALEPTASKSWERITEDLKKAINSPVSTRPIADKWIISALFRSWASERHPGATTKTDLKLLESLVDSSSSASIPTNSGEDIGNNREHKLQVSLIRDPGHPDIAGLRLSSRNVQTGILPCMGDPAQFVSEAVTYLYRYGISSVESDSDLTKTRMGEWARGHIENRLRGPSPMIGHSASILGIYPRFLDAVEHPKENILVYGQIGSGKEVVYDILRLLAPQNRTKFMVVDMSGLTGTWAQSELFGHVKGAFPGAEEYEGSITRAGSGTLVIDNFQNTPFEVQAQLLRSLEPGRQYRKLGGNTILRARCRIIIGLNIAPDELIESERLLPDLPSRFGIEISVPDLKSRLVDVPLLVNHIAQKFIDERGWSDAPIAQSLLPDANAVQKWMSDDWSKEAGNVRGLRKAVHLWISTAWHLHQFRTEGGTAPGRQWSYPGEEKLPKKRGRKPGRDLGNAELYNIIFRAHEAARKWHISKVFDEIDLVSRKKMIRTRGALSRRVDRMDDPAKREECRRRLSDLPGFGDLPLSER